MIEFLPYPQDNLLYVLIEDEEYDYAVKAGEFMSVLSSRGEWGQGYTNTPSDKNSSRRTGRLGEIALGKLIHQDIDSGYRVDGDEYDFVVNGITIDIKTSYQHRNVYRTMQRTDTGHIYKYECDYYIFAYKDYDYREKRQAKIIFDGYVYGSEIRGGKFQITEANSNRLAYNYLIPYTSLRPFSEFYYKLYKGNL